MSVYHVPLVFSDENDDVASRVIHCRVCGHFKQTDKFLGMCEVHQFWFPSVWDYCSKAVMKSNGLNQQTGCD